MERLTIQKIALERFDHLVHFPLRTIDILEQLLDAVPMASTVELAIHAFVEELTVLLTNVLLILLTMSDLHWPLPCPGLMTGSPFPSLACTYELTRINRFAICEIF
jgi:hypothetical protein